MTEEFNDWIKRLRTRESPLAQSGVFRPETLSDFVGQAKAKRLVQIMVQAAHKEHRPLPNILISGPFGQGKSALAHIIAGKSIPTYDAATINRDISLVKGTVVIDEIHNLAPEICDSLNMVLDGGRAQIIGCTTDPGKLPRPFASRFRSVHLEPYSVGDISTIIANYVKKRDISANSTVIRDIAKRSRLNPRMALNYTAMVADLMSLKLTRVMNTSIIREVFKEMGVDENGLTERDRAYLSVLPERPVGLQYLASRISVDQKTIEEEIEPFLMSLGLIDRTPRGRVRV